MALDYQTIRYKSTTQRNSSSEPYKDLLQKTWDVWPENNKVINPLIVNEYYVGRPDLISLAIYGTDEYGDMICKFNGISNPFDLNEGMLLQIPPLSVAHTGCDNREYSACDLIKENESIREKNTSKTPRNMPHSSSTALTGDEPPFIIDKTVGLVLY